MNPFVQLKRTPETFDLIKDHKAFVLATIIALRTRRTNRLNIDDLSIGESKLGDHKEYGMTEGQYREAKKRLEKYGFATFRTTNRGTIAKLINTDIFDPNVEENNEPHSTPATDKQRASNGQATTNKNDKKEKNSSSAPKRTSFKPPTLPELQAYITQYSADKNKQPIDAEAFIDHYTSNGWMVGKNKMKNWKAAVRTWFKNQPTQRSSGPDLEEYGI